MNRKNRIICLLILVGIASCNKEGDDPTPLPTIETIKSEVLGEGGVIFYGNLISHRLIVEHGFLYSKDSSFSHKEEISLGTPSQSGEYVPEVCTGLEPEQVYFFQAFAEIENGSIIRGEVKAFISSGSKPPIIGYVIPEKGHLEDTIQIHGQNFGINSYYSKTYLNGKRASILQQNDSIITCIIPNNIDSHIFTIQTMVFDKSDSIPFELYTPKIEALSPIHATFRDTIEVIGEHFDFASERNSIALGNIEVQILSSSRNKISFVVPDNLENSLTPLKLNTQLQGVLSGENFKLIPPQVISVPECSFTNEQIVLEGENFHPIHY